MSSLPRLWAPAELEGLRGEEAEIVAAVREVLEARREH